MGNSLQAFTNHKARPEIGDSVLLQNPDKGQDSEHYQ